MHRRDACQAMLLSVLGFGLATQLAPAQAPTVDLKTRLEKGLRARLPSEFEFIERVVTLVNAGVLPELLVNKIFFWARAKPKNNVQYFRRALVIQAAELGIDI